MLQRLNLGPYEVCCFALPPETAIGGFKTTVPSQIREGLNQAAAEAFGAMKQVRDKGRFVPGMDTLEERMRSALAQGRFAFLRRALTSYVVRKCREIGG